MTSDQDQLGTLPMVTIEDLDPTAGRVGGQINLSAEVIATIAGIAARQVDGIHALGQWKFLSFGEPRRGVKVEVGRKEAALDLDVVLEYGADVRQAAAELQRLIVRDVDRMAGRKVVEINIRVVGIHLPDKGDQPRPAAASKRRVE